MEKHKSIWRGFRFQIKAAEDEEGKIFFNLLHIENGIFMHIFLLLLSREIIFRAIFPDFHRSEARKVSRKTANFVTITAFENLIGFNANIESCLLSFFPSLQNVKMDQSLWESRGCS